MSDETNQSETVTSALPPVTTEVLEFRKESACEGFKYTVPNYNTVSAAQAAFGDEALLNLLNNEVANRISMKAKAAAGFNQLATVPAAQKVAKKAELRTALTNRFPDGIIYSADDALGYRPNTRELTFNQVGKKVTKLMAEGKIDEAMQWIEKMKEMAAAEKV